MGTRSVAVVTALVAALVCAPASHAAADTVHEFIVSVQGVQEHSATAVDNEWMQGDSCPADASSSERWNFHTRRGVRLQVIRRRNGGLIVVYRQGRGWGNPYPALVDGSVTRDNTGYLACRPAEPARDCGTRAVKSFEVEILGQGTAKRPRWYIQNSADRNLPHFDNCQVARDTERAPRAFPGIWDRRGSLSDIDAKFLYTGVAPAKLFNRRVKKFTATGKHTESYQTKSPDWSETVRFTQSLTYILTFKRIR